MRSSKWLGFVGMGLVMAGCGNSSSSSSPPVENPEGGTGEGGKDSSVPHGFKPQDEKSCVGLQCQQVVCSSGTSTSLSGKVYAPEGTIPLYNAIVYVPNATVDPFKDGVQCDQCTAPSGSPVVSALTDATGAFKLDNAPAGANIPVVIQVGKWRRQIKIANVTPCQDTAVAASETHLPRNKSEGDMPQMAITTGGADSLECFLRKMGIDDAEFTPVSGSGKIHFYQGSGGAKLSSGTTPNATTLWNSLDELKKHDIVLLSCEGGEDLGSKITAARQNMLDYLNTGGKVFASHFHYVWFRYGPSLLPTVAAASNGWLGSSSGSNTYTSSIDTSFPKGAALADWLLGSEVSASTMRGQISLNNVANSLKNINPGVARLWISANNESKYVSFNTPIGIPLANQCGRGVFTDLHVSGGGSGSFPTACGTSKNLSAQEKALLFFLFDLAACVQDENKAPVVPAPR